MKTQQKILEFLARPTLLFYALPWLLMLLVLGTLSQRYIGLYEAEKRFFSSFILWISSIPLPGMYSVLSVIGISLIAKLWLKSPWNKKTAGNIITHFGALLLLLGAALTAYHSEEGSLTLEQDETSNIVLDYHQREIAVLKNGDAIKHFPAQMIRANQKLEVSDLPFTINVKQVCRHCEVSERRYVSDAHKGIAEKIEIKPAALKKEDEANQFGMVFSVQGSDDEQDGEYIAFEVAPHQPSITVGEDVYHIAARKIERTLPFFVRLESFKKFTYPGSNIAEEYESVVSIIDGELQWESPIRMNEPLRYKGYTLYQSSFMETPAGTFSILAVVKNAGRSFPYISSIVMSIGLIFHLVMRRRKKKETI